MALTACVAAPIGAQQPGAKPDHMQHKFDDPAKFAKSFDDPKRDEWQVPSRVIDALGLKSGMRLAKVPGVSVYSVDIEPKMVEHLKQRALGEKLANVTAVLAGAASPNLPKPVDVVLIVDTYHHIGSRTAYFRDLKKSLKPGGRVAIVDFRKDSPEGPPVEFRFTAEQIEAEMKLAGYALDGKHDFLPRQHFLIFR